MALPSTIQDRDFNNFADRGGGETDRFVRDTEAHTKLDAIVTALGGSSNVTPALTVFDAPLANTEYSFALPASCKGFVLKSRKIARLNFGYATGVLTTYFGIPLGGYFRDTNMYASQSIFFSSSVAGNKIEIITYT